MDKTFDLVCIGAGPGGYVSAIRASQLGKKVAVIDISRERVGGVCLNEGCIPAKAIIRTSEIYASMRSCGELLGFETKISKPNMKRLMAFSEGVIEKLRKGIFYLFKKYSVTFIEGKATLTTANEVSIELKEGGRETLKAKDIILACGSKPRVIPGLECDGSQIISSSEAIKLSYIPKSILIVGGGAIGIEFASLFNNLGSEVTIVEEKRNILPGKDEELSKSLKGLFKKRKINIYNEVKIEKIDKQRKSVKVIINTAKGKEELEVDLILVAAGRVPNTSFEDFSKIGIELEKDGFVKVDHNMRTTNKNVYAVGDITGQRMFAHIAYQQAEIAAEALCGKKTAHFDLLNVPSVMYSDIQVATVGLSEEEVKEKGYDYVVSKQHFRSNSRSIINCQVDGFVKIIADRKTRKFLGVHILGFEASEIIHQFVVAKSGGLLVDEVAKFVYGHPTFAEIAKDACLSVFDKPIHS